MAPPWTDSEWSELERIACSVGAVLPNAEWLLLYRGSDGALPLKVLVGIDFGACNVTVIRKVSQ